MSSGQVSPTCPIRVALVNDYEIVVEGLRNMLAPFSDRIQIVELEAGGVPDRAADIALFDTFAARRGVGDRLATMADDTDVRRVVLYTWDAPLDFVNDAGDVDGIVLKSVAGTDLVRCLERIHAGERLGFELVTGDTNADQFVEAAVLSDREREVLALLAQGHTNRQIADELYLAVDTVKSHVKKLFSKLDVSNRTQAAIAATSMELGPPTR